MHGGSPKKLGAQRIGRIALVLALCACGSASPAPCTDCLSVAGTYAETAERKLVSCDDNRLQLSFSGLSGSTTVTQSGSEVHAGFGLSGVLHEDGSAIFGPVPAVAQPADGVSAPTPGTMRLAGWFLERDGAVRFDGTYVFIADTNGCEIAARTALRR